MPGYPQEQYRGDYCCHTPPRPPKQPTASTDRLNSHLCLEPSTGLHAAPGQSEAGRGICCSSLIGAAWEIPLAQSIAPRYPRASLPLLKCVFMLEKQKLCHLVWFGCFQAVGELELHGPFLLRFLKQFGRNLYGLCLMREASLRRKMQIVEFEPVCHRIPLAPLPPSAARAVTERWRKLIRAG